MRVRSWRDSGKRGPGAFFVDIALFIEALGFEKFGAAAQPAVLGTRPTGMSSVRVTGCVRFAHPPADCQSVRALTLQAEKYVFT
jgi:hypothetical protein